MKRYILSAMIFFPFMASAAKISGGDLRDQLVKEFKSAVLQQVLVDSQNANSTLRSVLAKYDQADGRNPDGNINIPLTANDINLVLTQGEDGFGSYCEDQGTFLSCERGKLGTFLVAVASFTGIHKASEYETVLVQYKAEKRESWREDRSGKLIPGSERTSLSVAFDKELSNLSPRP